MVAGSGIGSRWGVERCVGRAGVPPVKMKRQ